MFASWRYRAGDNTPLDPRIDLNFIDGSAFDERIAFTRASNAWDFDVTGTLVQYSANTPRIAYDPVTLDVLGFHVEESRTNNCPNPRCEGAVPGTPGTPLWTCIPGSGISLSVIGGGVEDGLPYLDLRVFGTYGVSGGTVFLLRTETIGAVAASPTQSWVHSAYVKVVAGETAGFSGFSNNMLFLNGSNGQIGGTNGAVSFTPTGAALSSQRVSSGAGVAPTGAASVLPQIWGTAPQNAVVDITLRIGLPQLELGAFATSPIMPPVGSPAASTRAAEHCSMPGSAWLNPSAGSVVCEFLLPQAPTTNAWLATLSDGTINNEIRMYVGNSGGLALSDGADSIIAGSVTFEAAQKSGYTYSGQSLSLALNGALLGSKAVSAGLPTISQMDIGVRNAGYFLCDGYIRRVMYYPFALTAAQLQQVTAPDPDPVGPTTPAGVSLPYGWNLVRTDTFGTNGSVPDYATLHKLYLEGQYYDTNPDGTQSNNPINSQQQSYQSFESATAFSTDHLTIQGRGQTDGSIHSAQMTSRWMDRSFVFEAKFKTPNTAGTWVEFWAYPALASGSDASELDVEVVQTASGGSETVNEVFFANHGDTATNINVADPANFNTDYMRYVGAGYDASTAPHSYTIYYDDATGTIKRYLDGVLMYTANWKWMQSLGGTGFGADANCTIDLAIGGSWPGNVSNPSTWTGDLDIYSISYYTKRAMPSGQAWNQGHRSAMIALSANSLTATKVLTDGTSAAVYGTITKSSGKWYWEVVLHGLSNTVGAGIGTSLSSIFSGRYLGEDSNTLGQFGNNQIVNNNANIASVGSFDPSVAGGVRLCFALDLDNDKLWTRIATTGNWLGDVLANQNPATNTGGLPLPAALQADVCPAANLQGVTVQDSVVGAFTAASIAGTPPTGFSTFS